MAARFPHGEIGCVATDMEDYVTERVSNGDIQMCCSIIKEACDYGLSVFSGLGLNLSDGPKCNKHSWIDCSCIIEQHPNDLLNVTDLGLVERQLSSVSMACTLLQP